MLIVLYADSLKSTVEGNECGIEYFLPTSLSHVLGTQTTGDILKTYTEELFSKSGEQAGQSILSDEDSSSEEDFSLPPDEEDIPTELSNAIAR